MRDLIMCVICLLGLICLFLWGISVQIDDVVDNFKELNKQLKEQK